MSKGNITTNYALQPVTPRRSLRLLRQNSPPEFEESDVHDTTPLSSTENHHLLKKSDKHFRQLPSKKSIGSELNSTHKVNSRTGLKASTRSNDLVDGFVTPRRSPRFSSGGNGGNHSKRDVTELGKSNVDSGKSSRRVSGKCRGKSALSDGDKCKLGVDSSDRVVESEKRVTRSMVRLRNDSKCKDVVEGELGQCRRGTSCSFSPMSESNSVIGEKGKEEMQSCAQKRGETGSFGSTNDALNKSVQSDARKGELGANLRGSVSMVPLDEKNGKVGIGYPMLQKCNTKSKNCAKSEMVNVEVREKKVDACGNGEVVKLTGKRKRDDKDGGVIQGWTEEQELALHRAYYASEPTPHFWKRVSKMVPGKSAQECFDKVHSNCLTPPQRPRRSRAKISKASSVEHSSLSASKLLKPTELKKSTRKRGKTHHAQKTVRHLLEKNNHVNKDYETDLFSILESKSTSPSQGLPNNILSTPKCVLQVKESFLQKCHERSSSGCKRPMSKLNSLSKTALVSPPVLKQVKNRALHEKYIDQLHCREAKRKTELERAETSLAGKENRLHIHAQKMDAVRAAKKALVSDARDVINQLQTQQAYGVSNSSDCDYDDVNSVDEGEFDLYT